MSNNCFYKKNGSPNLGRTGLNQAQNRVFHPFLEFQSYVFLEMEYDDSLPQCLTSSREKSHEKNWDPNLDQSGQNWSQNVLFFSFSQVWFISFPLTCIE